MREMIGVVKYTCDFCGGTITKPSSTISRLPGGWHSVEVPLSFSNKTWQDRCPQCKEKHASQITHHICGANGFGLGLDDHCPACEASKNANK